MTAMFRMDRYRVTTVQEFDAIPDDVIFLTQFGDPIRMSEAYRSTSERPKGSHWPKSALPVLVIGHTDHRDTP